MIGKMELRPKMVHNSKPVEVTLSDGRVVKSVQCEPSATEKVWTRVIKSA